MKFFPILLLLCYSLLSDVLENTTFDITSILSNEFKQSLQKEENPEFENDNTFATRSFFDALLAYDISSDFYLLYATKTDYQLVEKPYSSALYAHNEQNASELNKIVTSQASLNYDNDFLALNIGRNAVDYNFLSGSMDGVISMIGDDKSLSFRLFYLENLQQFYYNYFAEYKKLNESKGFYGAINTFKKYNFDVELYNYYLPQSRSINGLSLNYSRSNSAINISHTYMTSLNNDEGDEAFTYLSFEYLHYPHYIEFGASISNQNGLSSLFQYGAHNFSLFYLSNQMDRENAKNGFLKYIFNAKNIDFESLIGATEYDNSYIQKENSLKSFEIDTYLHLKFSKRSLLNVALIYMNVDEKDPIVTSQTTIVINMVYKYESF